MPELGELRISYSEKAQGGLFEPSIRWWLLECTDTGKEKGRGECWRFIAEGKGPIPKRWAHLPREKWNPESGRWELTTLEKRPDSDE